MWLNSVTVGVEGWTWSKDAGLYGCCDQMLTSPEGEGEDSRHGGVVEEALVSRWGLWSRM